MQKGHSQNWRQNRKLAGNSDVKHPIFLPKSHRITKIILERTLGKPTSTSICTVCHCTAQIFWRPQCNNKCNRQRVHTAHQFMADHRGIATLRMWLHWPFMLKQRTELNTRRSKGCLTGQISHTSESQHRNILKMWCLCRFMALRGKCSSATIAHTFFGCTSAFHMKCIIFTRRSNINIFIPIFNTLGKKMKVTIHSVKLHPRRVVKKTTLTFEHMHTPLAQIGAVVNSRPLPYLSPVFQKEIKARVVET